MRARVLVTGATGLVGAEVVDHLRSAGHEVVATSRRGAPETGDAVAWDMTAAPPPDSLRGPFDAIVHAAADTRWTMPYDDARRANVEPLRALAEIAAPGTHLVHVSTAYATGLRGGVDSPETGDYRNSYEWSKAAAERLARELFERVTIVRPPLIVGRRGDGRAARFAGLYTILRGITSSTVPAIVADPDAYLDVIPVDDLGRLLAGAVAGQPRPAPLTIAGGAGAPRVEPMLEAITDALNEWRAERGCAPFDSPRLMEPDSWNRFFLPFARDHLTERQLRILSLLENFQPYLAMTEPLAPTNAVTGVEPAIAACVRYWADANSRVASMEPRPWTAAA